MTPMPKVVPVRSPKYLRFIRSKPCLCCGRTENIHAAHQSFDGHGIGTKASDLFTVPLCLEHHMEEHATGTKTFWSYWCVDRERHCLRLINEYVSGGGTL